MFSKLFNMFAKEKDKFASAFYHTVARHGTPIATMQPAYVARRNNRPPTYRT